eukprot:TRINITY_DN2701_c0_g1_i1.p1 TRINITY_DN2701_c0_g1~~TRINITY_DN2701_c0_g1_i1.p1  ORF type:complete len:675 (+),score=190.85 TRINITY_DN2701_c0_g1_i1:298-2025(+)
MRAARAREAGPEPPPPPPPPPPPLLAGEWAPSDARLPTDLPPVDMPADLPPVDAPADADGSGETPRWGVRSPEVHFLRSLVAAAVAVLRLAASAAAASRPTPAPPKHRPMYVSMVPGSGTVFEAMVKILTATGHFECLPLPSLPPEQHSGSWAVTKTGDCAWSCCGQQVRAEGCLGRPSAKKVDLLLGDKTQIEAMIESRIRMEWLKLSKSSEPKGYRLEPHTIRGPTALARLSVIDRAVGNLDRRCTPLTVNYLLGSRRITLKTRMVRTLRGYPCADLKPSASTLAPPTFILYPQSLRAHSHDERRKFREAWEQGRMYRDPVSHSNAWCAKPSNGAKGARIKISRSYEALLTHIDNDPDPHPWVVQRYVERPLLVDGRKFDIRVWVLVVAPFTILYYKRGVCRTTSCDYAGKEGKLDLSDSLAHLTNNAVQKEGPDYCKYEEENFLWFEQVEEKLAKAGSRKSFWKDIVPEMKAMVVSTLRAARPYFVDAPPPIRPFQLMGFDFLPDAAGKLWLLEVNGSPAIAHTPQYKLEDWMVADMAEIVVAPVHKECGEALTAAREAEGRESGFEVLYQE